MEQVYCERFWKYREQFHLTQEELAERIGVSRQTVSKWERGEASPDTENLLKLSELYGVSIDMLLHKDPSATNGVPSGAKTARSAAGDTASGAARDATDGAAGGVAGDTASDAVSGTMNGKNGDANGAENAAADENKTDGTTTGEAASGATDEAAKRDTGEATSGTAKGDTGEATSGTAKGDTGEATDGTAKGDIGGDENGKKRGGFPVESLTGAVAIAATVVYLLLGFCCNLWHPGWLIFFLIPIFATFAEAMDGRQNGRPQWNVLTGAVAISATAVYLLLGFCMGLWHPGWLVFLLIPIWAVIAEAIDRTD